MVRDTVVVTFINGSYLNTTYRDILFAIGCLCIGIILSSWFFKIKDKMKEVK